MAPFPYVRHGLKINRMIFHLKITLFCREKWNSFSHTKTGTFFVPVLVFLSFSQEESEPFHGLIQEEFLREVEFF